METSTLRKSMPVSALFDTKIIVPAIASAFVKLDPRTLVKNPVMFVLEIVTILTTVILVRDLATGGGDIGYGVAVPHGKTPALSTLGAVAGTTPSPVRYETIDGEPVRIFFMLAGPESQAGAHVKAISRISRLVRHELVRARLLEARTPEEFHRVLCEAEGA